MSDFETELKQTFLEEAAQLVSDMESAFLELESKPGDVPTLEKIFRCAHNLKGSSKAVGFSDLGTFTHHYESLLLKVKNGEIPCDKSVVTLLLKAVDHLRSWVEMLRGDVNASLSSGTLIAELDGYQPGVSPSADAAQAPEALPDVPAPAPELDTPSVTVAEAVVPQPVTPEPVAPTSASEHVAAPPVMAVAPASPPPSSPGSPVANPTKVAPAVDDSIRVSLGRLDRLQNDVGELVILQAVLKEKIVRNSQDPESVRVVHQIEKAIKLVQTTAMGLRMVPMRPVFQKMQRIVRDTAHLLGKDVRLVMEGEDTEVDKTVLELLGDPLTHMIRNSVDHGIESAEARTKAGKPAVGTVTLRAQQKAGKLVIEILDDGGGIDTRRLIAKAQERGLVRGTMDPQSKEALRLIFAAGLSTKAQVTEVSGRGVGMDVVKTNVEKIQGEIDIHSTLGAGTRFTVSLPLSLAITDALTVETGGHRFVIALSQVAETVGVTPGLLRMTEGLGEVVVIREETIPVVRLSRVLRVKETVTDPQSGVLLLFRSLDRTFGLLVEQILAQTQIVIKNIGPELRGIRGVSGSAILGDGRPALILEPFELANIAAANPSGRVAA